MSLLIYIHAQEANDAIVLKIFPIVKACKIDATSKRVYNSPEMTDCHVAFGAFNSSETNKK